VADFNWEQPVIIVGCLVEKEGKYLFVKEASGPQKGTWNLPAGKLDLGETVQEGALRETLEETGFECETNSLLGIYRSPNVPSVYVFIFNTKVIGETGEVAEDVSEVRWFSRDEIMAMGPETLRSDRWKDAINDFESGVTYSIDIIREIS
jgi:ADP-ribose pyrophosphatase YjhB (NUDIX family)